MTQLCPGWVLQAGVLITGIDIEGQTGKKTLNAGMAKPLRISANARRIQYQFSNDQITSQTGTRLRFKLEGYDEGWRDLPMKMQMLVLFYDRAGQLIGSEVLYMEGETPGWRGSVETSAFVSRRGQMIAPERAARMQLAILSSNAPECVGVIAVDALRVMVNHPGGSTRRNFDLSVARGTDLSDPLGTPFNWVRAGSRAEIAKLRRRLGPAPHPVLALEDDSPTRFGNWAMHSENAVPVTAGDRVTITWQTAHSIGASGPGRAAYGRLKPGNYWFRVAAFKANGEPTGIETSLPLEVVPPFYRRLDFWLMLLASAVCGAVWFGRAMMKWRMQQRIRQMEREQALERERARIARNMHDELGASLAHLAMISDQAQSKLMTVEEAKGQFNYIYHLASDLTQALDEIVWAVAPSNDTLERMVDYLIEWASGYLEPAGLLCRIQAPEMLPPVAVDSRVRHALCLALKECLANIVKHAGAQDVTLAMSWRDGEFTLTACDDGAGFDAKIADRLPAGHDGLRNIRARLEEIGGKLVIASRPGEGTSVTMSVRIPDAAGGVRKV